MALFAMLPVNQRKGRSSRRPITNLRGFYCVGAPANQMKAIERLRLSYGGDFAPRVSLGTCESENACGLSPRFVNRPVRTHSYQTPAIFRSQRVCGPPGRPRRWLRHRTSRRRSLSRKTRRRGSIDLNARIERQFSPFASRFSGRDSDKKRGCSSFLLAEKKRDAFGELTVRPDTRAARFRWTAPKKRKSSLPIILRAPFMKTAEFTN